MGWELSHAEHGNTGRGYRVIVFDGRTADPYRTNQNATLVDDRQAAGECDEPFV